MHVIDASSPYHVTRPLHMFSGGSGKAVHILLGAIGRLTTRLCPKQASGKYRARESSKFRDFGQEMVMLRELAILCGTDGTGIREWYNDGHRMQGVVKLVLAESTAEVST